MFGFFLSSGKELNCKVLPRFIPVHAKLIWIHSKVKINLIFSSIFVFQEIAKANIFLTSGSRETDICKFLGGTFFIPANLPPRHTWRRGYPLFCVIIDRETCVLTRSANLEFANQQIPSIYIVTKRMNSLLVSACCFFHPLFLYLTFFGKWDVEIRVFPGGKGSQLNR